MNDAAEEEAALGLTSEEVQMRIAAGEVNVDAGVKTRSVGQIVHDNICTLFNLVNAVLALIVLFTGSYKNMLFMVVIVCNTVIGIVQEVRSKRITDKLSIIAGTKSHTLRDSAEVELPLDQLVRDDVVVLRRGDQVPADAQIVSGECRVNESLLTGEGDLIRKQPGDALMSGSFINSGMVYARVVHVGAENYAAKISAEAKERKAVRSEIMRCLNGIIKFVSCIMFPLGALLFARDYFWGNSELNSAILSTVSALVGMIPEGLILLTSTVLAVSVVRLSKSQVLVQQLYCIETLARVDVLCLDKTGTITTGDMEVAWVHPVEGMAAQDAPEVLERETRRALRAIACGDDDPNETSRAIASYFKDAEGRPETCVRMIPFSSDKKWSGVQLSDGSCYAMGAAQFVFGNAYEQVRLQVEQLAADARLLLIARVQGFDELGNIQGVPRPLGFVGIRDQIRSTAAETIAYFKDQGVRVLVISGDDPRTVSGIAEKVGVEGAERFVDASTLRTDADVDIALASDSVFGRVRPEQKKQFVLALQKAGHTVAMTGDGVNDTLALKAADCSVAMASGSDAARNVAQLVLVDNDFASMPKVVAEGRRSINNLQRSASLFLVKTLLSIAAAMLFIAAPWQYPFQPIQMTLISAFTIGIPSFVLALEPNRERIQGRFLGNVIVRSIPGAICSVCCILVANIAGYYLMGLDYEQVSTLCVLLTSWIGCNLVIRLSIPFTAIRAALLVVVVGGTVGACLLMPNVFCIAPLTPGMWLLYGIVATISAVAFHALYLKLEALHAARIRRAE